MVEGARSGKRKSIRLLAHLIQRLCKVEVVVKEKHRVGTEGSAVTVDSLSLPLVGANVS